MSIFEAFWVVISLLWSPFVIVFLLIILTLGLLALSVDEVGRGWGWLSLVVLIVGVTFAVWAISNEVHVFSWETGY